MKKRILTLALACTALGAAAQNTYLNDRLTSVDDINGSARFVGMGGAMGALGADLSVISSNPAGIGLYRKNDVGLTFGLVHPNGNGWDKDSPSTYYENLTRGTFDQAGLVWSMRTGGGKVRFLNFAFNYQKKINFTQGFYADNNNLNGLSQMTQLAELASALYSTDYNLAGLAEVPVYSDPSMDAYYLEDDGDGGYTNPFDSQSNQYTRHQSGSVQSYDFNVSLNILDRVYVGATFGVENVDYHAWSEYGEYDGNDNFNYSVYNDEDVSGYGLNGKVGVIVRPMADKPFRIGLAVETPTWYNLTNSTWVNLDQSDQIHSRLEYNMHTPWKMRLSLGSTVSDKLAWGVEYEVAAYNNTSTGYPRWDTHDDEHCALRTVKDRAMNAFTSDVLKPQHTLRLGLEVRPVRPLALRIGYNFISSRYEDDANYDQYSIDSQAMDYSTSTDYMTLSSTNILTLGVGYQYKKFYVDLAYKYRAQSGDFYAFDTTGMDGARLAPVDVNLDRHQLTLGFGLKF